ncbi:SPOR domain-containing protein [Pseudopelagicola sp. nBUS_20]|uniref:SPOR domain-containing protein n=1 Tax=Pseudopelagicola sp. nBUS_20 TaxID=3395317 RepID=UPI003EC135E6
MAEIPNGTRAADLNPYVTPRKAVNWVGAGFSLALVAGACLWSYQIMVRDVSGVPIVRALEGPMREKPKTPGGRPAENQGLAVNRVAADGVAAKPADRLVLAPPPIALTATDEALTQAKVPVFEIEKLDAPLATPDAGEIIASMPSDGNDALSVEELAERLAAGVTPLSETPKSKIPSVEKSIKEIEATKQPTSLARDVIEGGLKKSLRPVVRPASLATNEAERLEFSSLSQPIDAVPKAIDASDIPPGTRMVQLGAFASPEIAAAEWDQLNAKFGDYLGDKSRVIQKATSGGKVFYRLRATGFVDVSDTRRLCSALKAESAECIPVTTR